MLTRKKRSRLWLIPTAVLLLAAAAVVIFLLTPWGFAREVSKEEETRRNYVLETAAQWLGCNEADGSHKVIIDLYNSHTPLAQGYAVQYSDNWCSTFVSAVAITCEFTHIIPTECGCERQTKLFMAQDCWEEDDSYIPLPGDLIFYCSRDNGIGDCTGWSDHVGIVAGTKGPFIKVIEGNSNDRVQYRYILANSKGIRGYATPDYLQ